MRGVPHQQCITTVGAGVGAASYGVRLAHKTAGRTEIKKKGSEEGGLCVNCLRSWTKHRENIPVEKRHTQAVIQSRTGYLERRS